MFEAYKVAVKLSLINNVSSGLVTLAGQFQALNRHIGSTQHSVNVLENKLLHLKRMGLVGGALAGAGAFGLSMFRAPLDEAKQFQLEVAKFESLGMGEKINRDAVEFAKGMRTYGTSLTENMVLFRDAQTVFRDSGSIEHAEMVTPMLAKMKFANETLYGAERAEQMGGMFMNMLRVIEMRRGLRSAEEFASQANMIQQVLTTSGGRVNAQQYLMMLKTGGVAAKLLSNEAMYYQLEPLIQEMGGFRVGTGLMSAYNNLILGRTSVQSAKELNQLGVLDPAHVEYNKIGMIKRILPGGLKGGDIMEKSPVDFLEKVLLPAFRAKGITSEQDTLREIGLIFSNRTASQLFSTIFLQLAQIRKGEKMSAGALNIDQASAKAQDTAIGKEIELHKKWRDVLNELGTAVLPIAIKAISGLTVVLRDVVAFAREFPTLTRWLTIGFGVLAGIVAVGGTLMLATAGFKALGLALSFGGGIGGLLLAASAPLIKFGGALIKLSAMVMTNPYVLAVLAAGGVGYAVGSGINALASKAITWATDGKSQSIGTWLYNVTHPDQSGGYVKPGEKSPVQVTTQLNVDGRKVAEAVTMHQSKDAQRPSSGAIRFDTRMMPIPVGASGRW